MPLLHIYMFLFGAIVNNSLIIPFLNLISIQLKFLCKDVKIKLTYLQPSDAADEYICFDPAVESDHSCYHVILVLYFQISPSTNKKYLTLIC